jgi:ureidoglycolate lyase
LTRNEDGSLSIEIGFLEKHPYTSQSFIPMGSKADAAYVVVVADDCTDGSPDFETLQAYIMKGNEGICYAAGVWHAPMAVVHEVSRSSQRGLSVLTTRLLISASFNI